MIIFFPILFLVSIGGLAFLLLRHKRLFALPSQKEMREYLSTTQTLPRELLVELEVPAKTFWHVYTLPWCYRHTEQLVHRFRIFVGRVEQALLEGARHVRRRRVNKERANAAQAGEGQGFWNNMLEWKNGDAERNGEHPRTTTPRTQSPQRGTRRDAGDSSSLPGVSESK